MKIAIVDDNSLERNNLQSEISLWSHDRGIRSECFSFESGEALLEATQKAVFDLIFMDIYMDGMTGYQSAEELRKDKRYGKCLIIFLTSSHDHMPEAFAVHAFDYIIKSGSRDRLRNVLDEASKYLDETQPYLTVNYDHQSISILYSDIKSMVSDMQYCIINCGKSIRLRKSFYELSDILLADKRFLLINRGVLINLDYVKDMVETVCHMSDGTNFPLNIKRNKILKQELTNYRFEKRKKLMREGRSS